MVGPFRGGSPSSRILAALAGLVWAVSAIWAIVLQRTRRFELLSMTAWQMVWGTLAMGTPMVGCVSGSLLLHEVATRLELTGIVCILCALVVNARVADARASAAPSTED